ncbi:uncharacterized protein LOC125043343 [Penaeus chinensis]|uniref:uncharacterized protein LOC125043343 n=1 Tax=Penaeus chinensis TaxID=139456 RepID=UPI001FB6710D|nr:uncharacterized protein LOC125043343 [Penaeus chinensis]
MSFSGGQCLEYDGRASFEGVSDPGTGGFGHAMDPQSQTYLQLVPLEASPPLYAIIPGQYQVLGVASVLHCDVPHDLQPQASNSSLPKGSSSRKKNTLKWYERGPQPEPIDEERRQRALKAKAHRQRCKQMEEQMAQEVREVNSDITNLRTKIERKRLTCVSLERALDIATQHHNIVDYSYLFEDKEDTMIPNS